MRAFSRRHTEDFFVGILRHTLRARPFEYERDRAAVVAEKLCDWWPTIANGDEQFAYSDEHLGDAVLAAYVNSFSDRPPPDNDFRLELPRRS